MRFSRSFEADACRGRPAAAVPVALLFSTLFATLSAGCGRQTEPQPQLADEHAAALAADRPASGGTATAGSAVQPGSVDNAGTNTAAFSDAAVTGAVKERLTRDVQLAGFDIGVRAFAGQVVLHGSVPDTAARKRAGEVAHAVQGVRVVENNLHVQPTYREGDAT